MDETPVLSLSPEQSQLLSGNCAVELRDHEGRTIGYLLHTREITRFYTPEELASLQRKAADRTGRTLNDIMADIRARTEA
jgi:hypothetical protein